MKVNDKNMEVLSLYDIDVEKVIRGRGAYMIWTDKGLYRLSEYSGTGGRLAYEEKLLKYIETNSDIMVDTVVRTKEDGLYGEDVYGTKYILKKWYEGNECDVKRQHDVLETVYMLAWLHMVTSDIDDKELLEVAPIREGVGAEYSRYNKELRRVRNYMRGRTRKSSFEYDVLARFDEYYGYADEVCQMIETSDVGRMESEAHSRGCICHGAYNYHNVIMQGKDTAIVNFDHSVVGLQVIDLYMLVRKVLEKHEWNIKLGHQMLECYDHRKPISDSELSLLKLMLSYPEKYRKLLNQYNNSNKSWIPDKNIEKLKVIYRQQELKMAFAKSL